MYVYETKSITNQAFHNKIDNYYASMSVAFILGFKSEGALMSFGMFLIKYVTIIQILFYFYYQHGV